jgi:hypothetical protein
MFPYGSDPDSVILMIPHLAPPNSLTAALLFINWIYVLRVSLTAYPKLSSSLHNTTADVPFLIYPSITLTSPSKLHTI